MPPSAHSCTHLFVDPSVTHAHVSRQVYTHSPISSVDLIISLACFLSIRLPIYSPSKMCHIQVYHVHTSLFFTRPHTRWQASIYLCIYLLICLPNIGVLRLLSIHLSLSFSILPSKMSVFSSLASLYTFTDVSLCRNY